LLKNNIIASFVIGLGFPLTQLTLLLYTPALPAMSHAMGVTTQQMLFTFSLLLMGYTLGNLFWGTLSDYLGRRATLLMGLVSYFFISCLVSLANGYFIFSIFLIAHGFVAATFTSVGNAMLKDIFGAEKVAKVISYVGIAMATTPAIAPVIGSNLFHYLGWHAIYYFVAIYSLIMLIGVLIFVPTTLNNTTAEKPRFIQGVKSHLTNRQYWGYVFSLSLLFGGIMTTLAMLPIIYMHYLTLPLLLFGYVSVVVMLSYPIGSIIASKLVSYYKPKQILASGLLLASMSMMIQLVIAVLAIKNIWLISIAVSFLFMGFGLSLSMAKAGSMISIKYHFGSASSLMKFTQSLGAMLITALNAQFHQQHSIINFTIITFIVLLLSLLVLKSMVQSRV
jgi:DHA1 family bicyclomycin/chloramphenicol resistance-like MFS transporter